MAAQELNSLVQRIQSEEVIDLRQYWRTLMRYKWGIVGLAFVVTLLAILVVFSIKPTYRATATLLIDSQRANVVSIEEVYGLENSNDEYLLTQFEILKSRRLAEKVVTQLNLQLNPEFNQPSGHMLNWRDYLPADWALADWLPFLATPTDSAGSPDAEFNQFVNDFRERVTVSPVRKTLLVDLSFEANDPQLAARVANTIGRAYIEDNLESKLEVTAQASSWLSGRLTELQTDKQAAEARLQQYLDEENLVGEDGGAVFANRQVDLVATKLMDAQRERMRLETVYKQIQNANGSTARYELVPGVLQDPTVQSIKQSVLQSELKVSELAKRYGPKHPKMISAQSELDRSQRSLRIQVVSVINGIKSDYEAALANERALESSLGESRDSVQEVQRDEFQRQDLQAEVDGKTAIYETFLQRFNETNATDGLTAANARVVDPAVVPVLPAKPNKKLVVVLALAVSLMLGVMIAFLIESMNNTIQTSDDVERKLGATLLGVLPLLGTKRANPHMTYSAYISDPQSRFSESVRTIRTGVVLSALDNPHKVIAVTSTVPLEGKTTVSMSLAYALGQMGRVLLIGADMRRPAFQKAMGDDLDVSGPGLSDFVAGTAKMEECIHCVEGAGIDVLASGTVPPNPLELLSSKRFAKMLEVLETKYDRIVIDTAQVQAVSDSLVISKLVGAMIYVVKADSTHQKQVYSGLKRLKEVDAPVIGVVLNMVNIKKAQRYYAEDYGGYYDSYGYAKG